MDLAEIDVHPHAVGMADYPPGATFGPRTTHDWQWVWIVDGTSYWLTDAGEHRLDAGSVLLAPPGIRDGFRWSEQRSTRHGFIHFSLRVVPAWLGDPAKWPHILAPGGDTVLLPLLRYALVQVQRGEDTDLAGARHALQLALHCLVSGRYGIAEQDRGIDGHPVVAHALATMRGSWGDDGYRPLTLGELAGRAGVSQGHLIRVFRAELGVSPQEAQRFLRLDQAATLLARSNLKVQAIAEQCGYQCPFHFSRSFKELYGRSPRSFRQHLAAGGERTLSPLVRSVISAGYRSGGAYPAVDRRT